MLRFWPLYLTATLMAIVVMFLLPVGPHDWGDDFALYLMQAADMSGRGTWTPPFWLPNPGYGALEYSPVTYPPGFPAILAPLYALVGLNIRAFQMFMSLLLVGLGWVTYRYAYHRTAHVVTSAAVALIVIFHIESLLLKQYIISDIPFTLLAVASIDRIERTSSRVWPALLAIATWLVRTAGIVLFPAWIAEAVVRVVLRRDDARGARANLVAAVATSASVGVLWLTLRQTQGYGAGIVSVDSLGTIGERYVVYRDMFWTYGTQLVGFSLAPIVFAGLAVLLAVGVWTSWARDRQSMTFWFCAAHAALLLWYPYMRGGHRMILPLLPFLWTYIALGWLSIAGRVPLSRIVRPAFALGLLLLTARQVHQFSGRELSEVNGPQSPAAQELVVAMMEKIPPGALTMSGKPRALQLLAHRTGTTLSPTASSAAVEQLVAEHHVEFVIAGEPLRNAALVRYCASHPERVVFSNDAFTICATH